MNKSIPTVFGCPLWYGKISRKVAKRYLASFKYSMMDTYRWQKKIIVNGKPFNETVIGDLVNDCSGFNVEVKDIRPEYRNVGKGYVLIGIDLTNHNGGSCSIKHCGVEPPKSREAIEKEHVKFLKEYDLGEGGRKWYEGQPDKYAESIDKALKQITLIEAGEHICDERGVKFP